MSVKIKSDYNNIGYTPVLNKLLLVLQISAQESRRKKKEYIEGLERRVTVFSSVNQDLKSRLSELEEINREMQEKIILLTSKRRQQKPVAARPPVKCCTVATQTDGIGQRGSEL